MPNDPLLGRVLADRYRIISPLGEGGMGRVYLAEHVKMGRKSAVKVMSPALALSADAIGRFHREAANASRINHPNVASIYDFGEAEDGVLYLAMEFIEGETLSALLRREGRLPVARAAELLRQAADALAAAHHLGIVHRDLKPDNIMLARHLDGRDWVKVVDFGIAKTTESAGRGSQTVTTAGVSIGTPDYMSPEQLAGERLDARTDVYALGLVLFNMLTGDLPYPRLTSKETLVRRLTAPPRTLAEVSPDVAWPPALQAALDRALAPELVDRFADAAALGRAVVDAAASAGPTATPADAPTVRVATQPPRAAAPTVPLASPRAAAGAGRGRRGAALAAIAVAGALLFVALRPRAGADTTLGGAPARDHRAAATRPAVDSTPPAARVAIDSPAATQSGAPAGAPGEVDARRAAPAPVRTASSAPRTLAAPTADASAASGSGAASAEPAPDGPSSLDPAMQARADSVLAMLHRGASLLREGDVRAAQLELRDATRAGQVLRQQLVGTTPSPQLEQQFREALRDVVAACVAARARGVAELASARCENLTQRTAPEAGRAGAGQGAGLRARRLRNRPFP